MKKGRLQILLTGLRMGNYNPLQQSCTAELLVLPGALIHTKSHRN